MRSYVLLYNPSTDQKLVVEATSKKHFSLVDRDEWIEMDSGWWDEMIEASYDVPDPEIIWLQTSTSLIQTTNEMLELTLDIFPDFLNDKEFI